MPRRGALELFELSLRALWHNPSIAVPVLFFNGLSNMASLAGLLALLAFVAYLSSLGLLKPLVDAIRAFNLEALIGLVLRPDVALAFLMTVVAVVVSTLVISALAASFAYSGLYKMGEEILIGGKTGLMTFLKHASENWGALFPLALLLQAAVLIPGWLFVLRALLAPYPACLIDFLGLLADFILLVLYLILFSLLTYFALVALALEPELGVIGALKASVRAFARSPGSTVLLVLFQGALEAGLSTLAGFLGRFSLGLSSLISLVVMLVLDPCFQVARVGIYIQAMGKLVPLGALGWRIGPTVSGAFRRGLKELKSFFSRSDNLILLLYSALTFAIGLLAGLALGTSSQLRYAARALGLVVPGRMNPLARWPYGLSLSFYVGFLNWRLAISSATSGLFFCVPILVFLFANGLVIGMVASLLGNPVLAMAALVPHGVIEIPAFLLASACGLRLGLAYRAYRKGLMDLKGLTEVVRTCVYAIIGLLPVFLLAGLIEGLLTPIIMGLFGWR